MIATEALDEAAALLKEWDLHDHLDRPQKVRQLAELLAKWEADGAANAIDDTEAVCQNCNCPLDCPDCDDRTCSDCDGDA